MIWFVVVHIWLLPTLPSFKPPGFHHIGRVLAAMVACLAAMAVPATISSVAASLASAPPLSSVGPHTSSLALSKRNSFGHILRLRTPLPGSRLHFSPLPLRAASSEETNTEASAQFDEIFSDLKSKWDAIDNKSSLFVYGGGALVALWLSSAIVGAINSVPVLPKVMELVGLGYTVWFVYRYLLFKENRKELASDIEDLKAKITGANQTEGGDRG